MLQVNRLQSEGYYGGVRLLMAICRVFHNYCKENRITLHDRCFTLSYDTNIPRQVSTVQLCSSEFSKKNFIHHFVMYRSA